MEINSESKKEICKVVNKLIRKYRNRDPFFIAKKLGIECVFLDFDDNLPAFSERKNAMDKGRIYINKKYGTSARKILCAHEMGHLLCHGDCAETLFAQDIEPEKEYVANYFAAMLMPHIIVNKDILELPIEAFNRYITQRVNCAFQFDKILKI